MEFNKLGGATLLQLWMLSTGGGTRGQVDARERLVFGPVAWVRPLTQQY